jgi:23S rRNA (cytidine1920-2'-O)/16S rRNA (cytidine1409-2'-O)-methyltransferase
MADGPGADRVRADGVRADGAGADSHLRLDAAIAERGLARSRTHAGKLVSDGLVTVDGVPVVKPSAQVTRAQEIVVAGHDQYVSRAAHKLVAALDAFGVNPAGRIALDAGASTGGFSQVLLERGAAHVIALDVGHGQLVAEIRNDPNVTCVEGFNVRDITTEFLAAQLPAGTAVTLVVADLSFISLTTVLAPMVGAVGLDADYVLLIKPQFEVGRTGIREGIVRNAGLRDDAVMAVLWAAWDLGLGTAGVIPSPIVGTGGNHEYLVWLTASHGANPTEWTQQVSAMTQ